MGIRTRLFIDFWNFQLNWNDRSEGRQCDWLALPRVLADEGGKLLGAVGNAGPLQIEETCVYASVKAGDPGQAKLRMWLEGFLGARPSYRVTVRERRTRSAGIWCNSCKEVTEQCPMCGAAFERAPEKGVDTAIVTDLLSLAWESAFDLAVIVSSDADFIPAVERVQDRGLKVVNATWKGHGHHLARACWGNFILDDVIPDLLR